MKRRKLKVIPHIIIIGIKIKIVEKQKTFLTNYFKNNNRFNRTGTGNVIDDNTNNNNYNNQMNNNTNYNPPSQLQNNTLDRNNNFNSGISTFSKGSIFLILLFWRFNSFKLVKIICDKVVMSSISLSFKISYTNENVIYKDSNTLTVVTIDNHLDSFLTTNKEDESKSNHNN